jgi:hypothetical protein
MLTSLLPIVAAVQLVAAAADPTMQDDLFREFDLYKNRILQLAKLIPEDKYDWSPAPKVRSNSNVILHVAMNNYMLLDMMGRQVPEELYKELPATEPARQRAIFQQNFKWENQKLSKQKVIEMAERAFAAAEIPLKDTPAADLNKPAMFGERKTTIGGLQLRMVAHLHEHLGQLIAYARSIGVVPPWSQ